MDIETRLLEEWKNHAPDNHFSTHQQLFAVLSRHDAAAVEKYIGARSLDGDPFRKLADSKSAHASEHAILRMFWWLWIVLAGALTSLLGVVSFRRAGTTVNPMTPESSSSLVVSGIYKLTRNPMYLGFLLALLGWTIFLSNVPALLCLPAFILYMNRFQIAPEERALAALFGQVFTAYKENTRRWL